MEYVKTCTSSERTYLLNDDFLHWYIWYYIDYVKCDFAPFHYEMFDDLKRLVSGELREVAWVAFRESGKTSLAKGFITWIICTQRKKYVNVDSFDAQNAERMLFDAILELQRNPRILADYGELYNTRRNSEELTQKKISNFLTNNNIRVEAHSTQESIRGRLHGAQRPDVLILDDFETNKTKDSEAYTAQVAGHISEAQSGMDANGIILYLCNYITEYGNVANLFKRAETDVRLRVRRVDILLPNNTPAWPSKYTLSTPPEHGKVSIQDIKKKLGPQVFDAEMMNSPIDPTSQEFLSTWFHYIPRTEVLAKNTRKFATIDSAMSKRSDSDNTGITKCYVDKENKWYLSARAYRVNAKSLIDLLFQLHEEGMEKIGIEETAYTEGVQPYFEEECRKRNRYPHIVPLKHGGVQKETRIRALIPRYANGDVYHIEGECADLESELLRFPKSKHDDVCFVAGTMITTEKGQVPIEKIKVWDRVMTRTGSHLVLSAGPTGVKDVVINIGLTGTPDHPVWIAEPEIECSIQSLQYVKASDILYIWNPLKQQIEKLSYIEARNIIGTQTHQGDNCESIFGDMTLGKSHQNLYIDKYGLITSVKFLKNFMCIIKTGTLSIMSYLISRLSLHPITRVNMRKNQKELLCRGKISKKQTSLQRCGMHQKKVKHGTKNMPKRFGIIQRHIQKFVNVVKKYLQHSKNRLDFVDLPVVTTSTCRKEMVYNLTVEGCPEYFANNILVHNCDATAYMSQIAEKPYESTQDDYQPEEKPLYDAIGI